LTKAEEDGEDRYVMFNKEHDGSTNTEKPTNCKAYNITDDSGLDRAFAEFGRVIFERLVLGFGHNMVGY
jgi:hypothetical protein